MAMGLHSDGIDTPVWTTALRYLVEALVHVFLIEIDGLRAGLLRQREALRNAINGNHMASAQYLGATNAELPDRTATPHGDRVAIFDSCELGPLIARRKNVGEKQDLFISQAVRNFRGADISEGNPNVFSLATGIMARQMGIAKEASSIMAKHFRGLVCVAICPLTARPLSLFAKEAFATANIERDDNPVSDFQFRILGADLDDLPHKLMPQDVATLHCRDVTVVKMKIRATYSGRSNLHDGIAGLFNNGIGDRIKTHVVPTVPNQSSHIFAPLELRRLNIFARGKFRVRDLRAVCQNVRYGTKIREDDDAINM